jgi:hypothetical protein
MLTMLQDQSLAELWADGFGGAKIRTDLAPKPGEGIERVLKRTVVPSFQGRKPKLDRLP